MKYQPSKIEKKWQKYWETKKIYRANDKSRKPHYYQLETFPYPSAAGLHVGHPKGYIAEDIHARFMRMKGNEVLYTMGWDAFGLPTENYAIKINKSPQEVATSSIKNFKRQVKMFGLSYDWDREINTSSPGYYKWTQWLFVQMFKRRLAYQKSAKVNWCPKDQTVLANEQVVDGKCERCGEVTTQKEMKQWFFKITNYADRLLKDLEGLDWPEATIKKQKDWVGKSEGAKLKFKLINIPGQPDKKHFVKVFTTRPDTLFGATFAVVSPELAKKWLDAGWQVNDSVKKYINDSLNKKELDRLAEAGDKTGIDSGIRAVNPANKEEIPVWVADYVLGGYGTGAIMAVPAHDERDFKFAEKFNLPVKTVISPNSGALVKFLNRSLVSDWKDKVLNNYPYSSTSEFIEFSVSPEGLDKFISIGQSLLREGPYYFSIRGKSKLIAYKDAVFDIFHSEENVKAKTYGREKRIPENELSWSTAYEEKGILINSGKFDGLDSEKAKWEITKFVGGERQVQYKIRDWSVSRQRYWGVPIPVIYCDKCGVVPVPDKDLPVKLPILKGYRPKGVPPLASSKKFLEVKCPNCNSLARRDAETLDTFVDSSWYYLRYTDSKNKNKFADELKLKTWLPVKLYVIGAEHSVLHLLYARFIAKVLNDQGYLNFNEPFLKLRHLGLILGTDGQKMSKSKGNVINPDGIVKEFGADAFRMYEMFMGPFEDGQPWDTKGVVGVYRFLNRVWNYVGRYDENIKPNPEAIKILNKYIREIGEDIKNLKFNTGVSSLMKLLNELESHEISKDE